MAILTEGGRRCQFATSSRSAASSRTVCIQGDGPLTQPSYRETICGIWDAGAIPAASNSSVVSYVETKVCIHQGRGLVSRRLQSSAQFTFDGERRNAL